jgi:hypothetical protein
MRQAWVDAGGFYERANDPIWLIFLDIELVIGNRITQPPSLIRVEVCLRKKAPQKLTLDESRLPEGMHASV